MMSAHFINVKNKWSSVILDQTFYILNFDFIRMGNNEWEIKKTIQHFLGVKTTNEPQEVDFDHFWIHIHIQNLINTTKWRYYTKYMF